MTEQIVREYVGGEWVTRAAASGPGGGSVSEITSTDMSVTITDPTGPTVDLSVSGGSQIDVIRIPLVHNTPGLVVTGLDLTTIDSRAAVAVGDAILGAGTFFSIPTETWQGDTPVLNVGTVGDFTLLGGNGDLTMQDQSTGDFTIPALTAANWMNYTMFVATAPHALYAQICKLGEPTTDPMSSTGEGMLQLMIARAA